MNGLQIQELSKRYGHRPAVDNLSLVVPAGSIFGLLGRNGAGKSTTINCILGLSRPTSGTVEILGQPLHPALFERVAYVCEGGALEGFMTGYEHAALRAREFPRFDKAYFAGMCDRFRLDLRARVRSLSKGQRQALALVLSFSQRPDVIILDEPSSGLDPVMQRCLLDTIVETGSDGTTVLFSSHQIGDVERTAERIAILDGGRLIVAADLEDLRSTRTIVEAVFPTAPPEHEIRAHLSSRYEIEGRMIRIYANGNLAGIERALSTFPIVELRKREMNLEDIFFASIADSENFAK